VRQPENLLVNTSLYATGREILQGLQPRSHPDSKHAQERDSGTEGRQGGRRAAAEEAARKAQREAIKRAQAAKKAGGGKPAAKKAVPLPRGSLRAAYPGTCPACFKGYGKGEVITKVTEGLGAPWLRTSADVGSRAGVRQEQGQDRQWRDIPRTEALGLVAWILAVY
jgi:hypothetical protein